MGRYDKIKVYHNGTWKTPKQIRVYSGGSWKDLGTDTSYSTKKIQVRNNNDFVTCTLNRRDETVVTDSWAQGPFQLLPIDGYNRYAPGAACHFRATIEKTEDVDQVLFYNGKGTPSSPGNSYFMIKWLANGTIQASAKDTHHGDTTTYTVTSSNAVLKNHEVYLNVYNNKGNLKCYIEFNGVKTSSHGFAASLVSGTTNQVGDTYVKFRYSLSVCGCTYKNTQVNTALFNASTASGTDSANYTGVTHHETTTTNVYYE